MTEKQYKEFKQTMQETKELYSKAYRKIKKPSTLQWMKEQYRIGISTKAEYLNQLTKLTN